MRFLIVMISFLAGSALAQGSADWSGSYGFPSTSRQQTNMTQADLIAKREAGYYDNIGKTTVYNITTTSIGTMSEDTININGENNTVTATGRNTGSLDASVGVQGISLNQSTYSADRLYGTQD
jgi:hypothetical protein